MLFWQIATVSFTLTHITHIPKCLMLYHCCNDQSYEHRPPAVQVCSSDSDCCWSYKEVPFYSSSRGHLKTQDHNPQTLCATVIDILSNNAGKRNLVKLSPHEIVCWLPLRAAAGLEGLCFNQWGNKIIGRMKQIQLQMDVMLRDWEAWLYYMQVTRVYPRILPQNGIQ